MKRYIKYFIFIAVSFGAVAVFLTQAGGGLDVPTLVQIDQGSIQIDKGDVVIDERPFLCGQGTVSHGGYDYSTVEIGDQCWFAEDLRYDDGCSGNTWNSSAPFNACDDAIDGTTDYGNFLYQWGAAMDGSVEEYAQGLCPDGWFIPTDEIWKELEGYVDSTYGIGHSQWDGTSYRGDDAGDQLKDPDEGWCNASPCGETGWDALPGGYRNTSGSIYLVGSYGYWWSSSVDGDSAWSRGLDSSNSGVDRYSVSQAYGFSVRCVSFKCGDDLYYEGHYYSTVEIGDQCWFAEDLQYDGGYSTTWNGYGVRSGGYDGLLYQWNAAMDGSVEEGAQGLCPEGWHIPTDEEIKILEGSVDSTYGYPDEEWDKSTWRGVDVGDQLKDPEEDWCYSAPCGESGWDALPVGLRNADGDLSNVNVTYIWWSSSVDGDSAWRRSLALSNSGVYHQNISQAFGLSVRCLQD